MIRACALVITLLQVASPAAATPHFGGVNNPHSQSSQVEQKIPHAGTTDHSLEVGTRNIQTLLTVTGISTQLPDIYSMLEQSRTANSDRCGATPDTIKDSIQYHPRQLHQRLTGLLQNQLSQEALVTVLQWYKTDIGQRIQYSEKKVRPADSINTYLTAAKQSPTWNQRQLLISKIEKYTGANRLGTLTGVEIEYGGLILSGCIESYAKLNSNNNSSNSTMASPLKNPELATAKAIRTDRQFFEKLFYQDTLASMAFSLQDVSDSELAQYSEFVASTDAHHVFGTLVGAIEKTLRAASDPVLPHTPTHGLPDTPTATLDR